MLKKKNRPVRRSYKARKRRKNQMTNYEKIKSMSFDEMYKFLDSNVKLLCKKCSIHCDVGKCSFALKDWLKAESEEE